MGGSWKGSSAGISMPFDTGVTMSGAAAVDMFEVGSTTISAVCLMMLTTLWGQLAPMAWSISQGVTSSTSNVIGTMSWCSIVALI
jgi:hypothetical protein